MSSIASTSDEAPTTTPATDSQTAPAKPVANKPDEIVAIENLTPNILRIVGPDDLGWTLSPLERRPVRKGELDGLDLRQAEAARFLRYVRRRSDKREDILTGSLGFLIIGGIAYYVIGNWLDDDLARPWVVSYWAAIPILTGLLLLSLLVWASGRGSSAVAALTHQVALLVALLSGVGIPVLALYLNDGLEGLRNGRGLQEGERLGLAMQLAFVALVSLAPALFYYIFDRERITTVRDAFFRNVFALDPAVQNLCDAEVKYGASAEEFFGRPDETRSGRIVRGQRLPILIATLLITIGWVFTMTVPAQQAGQVQSLASFFEPRQHPIAFAFLGAYFFALTTLARRYSHGDLTAKAYGQVIARIVLATILAWVVVAATSLESDSSMLLVLSFLVGVFPESGLLFVRESLPTRVRGLFPPLREKMPLTHLEGIDFYDRVRLAEEGVNNVQALVRHDLMNLMLRTRIPVSRLVDWGDQAILYLHANAGAAQAPGGNDRELLRAFGIRTATDLVIAASMLKEGEPEALAVIARDDIRRLERLRFICQSVQGEPLYRSVAHWRTSSERLPITLEVQVARAIAATPVTPPTGVAPE